MTYDPAVIAGLVALALLIAAWVEVELRDRRNARIEDAHQERVEQLELDEYVAEQLYRHTLRFEVTEAVAS